jgi:hypothetical protein
MDDNGQSQMDGGGPFFASPYFVIWLVLFLAYIGVVGGQ